MDSERWNEVDSILQSALDRAPEERDAFLRQACAGDETLEREVRSLLATEEEAEKVLEQRAARAIARKQGKEVSVTSDSLIGQTISHYRIVEKLGAGGMGVVWKARDTRLDRFVALKFLPAAKMSDPERKRRFAQEARAASALNHPHIITIYEIDQAGPEALPTDFIAMEYVPGKALDHAIPQKGVRLNLALEYAIQVADALAAAHTAGIVHRDLKPANIMVDDNGSVKVLDFGLAKLTEHAAGGESAPTETIARTPVTSEGAIVGTASYMSPEQAEAKKVDARSDIFSFGAVLYEMITGRRAFAGESMVSVLSSILRDEPKSAAEIVHGLPGDLNRIVTRCLQKDPNRRYQHAGDLKIDLQQVKDGMASGGPPIPEAPARRLTAGRWWWLAAIAACVAVSFAIGWRLHAPPREHLWKLARLTTDAGLSGFSALSPDGKLVAYSSDRSLDGAPDLYVKQVGGGQPIRLTFDGAGNTTPDFSPDGRTIVFRSNRDGGGIYVIPVFGGDVRLLARGGLNPKFSPDGSQVAYWVGNQHVALAIPGSGTVWVVPAAGGPPQSVAPHLTASRNPIWDPDGKHLLLIGYASTKVYEGSSLDWWRVATNGDDAVKTGVYEALVRAKLRASNISGPTPSCWSAATNRVIFSTANGDTENLWEIGISPQSGKANDELQRLTTGAGNEVHPACSSTGTLTFTNEETRRNVWLLPFDLDRGTPKGPLERITQIPSLRDHASLSGNGRYVAFASNQSGQNNIWLRDLTNGKEVSVAGSSLVQRYPVTNASGTRIAYSVYDKDKRLVYVSQPGGVPEKLCEGCLRATDWSRDEKTLLTFGGAPYQIHLLDLASHQQTLLLKHPEYHVLYGRFSPDNRWLSFTVRNAPDRGRIMIAPLNGPKPVPESAWIAIADGETEDWANWSPDGKTLYFTSARDGHSCLWGQRIDAVSHRPLGEAFAVQHLHGRVTYRLWGWSAAAGRIALILGETTGNIWTMSSSGTP